jgi:AcrR family transcriptional regulator
MRTPTPRQQPERPRGPVRRPQILATAVELLREQGLWNVRVSDVARRAHTSPGTVIYYFGTKHQLFEQAIADADAAFYASLWPELAQIESGIGRLACLIKRSSATDWVLWMDLWAYARRHSDMLEAEQEFHQRWRSTIADVIRWGQKRKEFGSVDADAVAVRFAALANGLAIRIVLDETDQTREDYLAMTVQAAALELGCDADELHRELAAVPDETEEAA